MTNEDDKTPITEERRKALEFERHPRRRMIEQQQPDVDQGDDEKAHDDDED